MCLWQWLMSDIVISRIDLCFGGFCFLMAFGFLAAFFYS